MMMFPKASSMLALLLVTLAVAVPTSSPLLQKRDAQTRYTIMDNDWGSTGFVSFLLALDGGMEVLALTSCMCPRLLPSKLMYRVIEEKLQPKQAVRKCLRTHAMRQARLDLGKLTHGRSGFDYSSRLLRVYLLFCRIFADG